MQVHSHYRLPSWAAVHTVLDPGERDSRMAGREGLRRVVGDSPLVGMVVGRWVRMAQSLGVVGSSYCCSRCYLAPAVMGDMVRDCMTLHMDHDGPHHHILQG